MWFAFVRVKVRGDGYILCASIPNTKRCGKDFKHLNKDCTKLHIRSQMGETEGKFSNPSCSGVCTHADKHAMEAKSSQILAAGISAILKAHFLNLCDWGSCQWPRSLSSWLTWHSCSRQHIARDCGKNSHQWGEKSTDPKTVSDHRRKYTLCFTEIYCLYQ